MLWNIQPTDVAKERQTIFFTLKQTLLNPESQACQPDRDEYGLSACSVGIPAFAHLRTGS